MLLLERRLEIQQFAKTVHAALGLQEFPYPIHKAIDLLHGTIEWSQQPIRDTCIVNTGESFTIHLSKIAVDSYKRWYLGHTLGHVFLHMGYLTDLEFWSLIKEYKDTAFNKEHTQVHEAEAYEFSRHLLLPAKELRRVCKKNRDDAEYNMTEVSKYFGVPVSAVKGAARPLGLY